MTANLSNTFAGRNAYARRHSAFTLVELLVVIGIIALLISILLPSLAAAREASKRAACAAKLQQIMVAANVFAVEHKGYFPITGYLNASGTIDPAGLGDTYMTKYAYMAGGPGYPTSMIAPITFALGSYMGFKNNLGATTLSAQVQADTDHTGVIRNFICPSQANDTGEFLQYCWLYAGNQDNLLVGYGEQLSYIFNEAVLGEDPTYFRLAGQLSRIRYTSKTMFACDGLGSAAKTRKTDSVAGVNFGPGLPKPPYPFLSMYNNSTVNHIITMNDALVHSLDKAGKPNAGDAGNFDQIRHKGKMNIAFCDGHVELRSIPKMKVDSSYNATFPGGVKPADFSDVYLLPPPSN